MQLLVVRDLKKHFPVRGGLFSRVREYVKAVDGVDLDLVAKGNNGHFAPLTWAA